MKKEGFIKRYGEKAYEKRLQQSQEWYEQHSKEKSEGNQLWIFNHPEKVKASGQEQCRKGGKYYEQKRKQQSTGIPHERELVRMKHGHLYRPYKKIIAPDSQIHHEWVPNTANYRGVALVETDQHMHGFIDVIQILEGEITLLTEEEISVGATK